MIDVAAALRNTVQLLQQEPRSYRKFGVYWWAVKKLLIASGYGPAQLYMLGSYQDPATAALVPAMPLQETLAAAFAEYGRNARYPHPGMTVEAPDGELVQLYDEDAGL